MYSSSRGLLFVASMFIGAGLGLAFDRPDVGGAIGMGVGFLAMALVRLRHEPLEVRVPAAAHSYFLLVLGLTLCVAGPALIWHPEWIYPYLVGGFMVLLGAGLTLFGARGLRPSD